MKKRLSIFSVIISMSFYAVAAEPVDSQKANEFWKWFASQSTFFSEGMAYKDNPTDVDRAAQTQIVHDVAIRLKTVHPEFHPFFNAGESSRKLIISVQGQQQYFAEVEDFVRQAPAISGWSFTALKPPVPLDPVAEIQTGTIKVKFSEIKYSISVDGARCSLVMYFPFKASNQEQWDGLAASLCEDALGERLSAIANASVTAKQLPTVDDKKLKPLTGLYSDAVSRFK